MGILAVVAAALVIILIRFRARPDDTGIPPQIEGNTLLEFVWTVVPIILLVILAVPTVRDAYALAQVPQGSHVLEVRVTGHQWWWEFQYPQLGITTADELHIPVGEKVSLQLTSADVIHAFWVPRLGGKVNAIPGQVTTMWLQADQPGTYPGQCAEFCGLSHAEMRFVVVAQSPSDFRQWVQEMKDNAPAVHPATAAAQAGMQLFLTKGCAACHTIDGTTYQGTVGPNLTGLGLRQVIAAGDLTNTPANLARWIADAPAVIPGIIMPDFSTGPDRLTSTQVQDLVSYLEGLR